jgi:DNA-binding transcriptional MerR regulator
LNGFVTKKSDDAFRTISEAAIALDLPQHVLRHWEDTFGAIRPMRRAGGRRYYRLQDIELLCGVRTLLHDARYTTKGVQRIFRERGAGHVQEIGREVLSGKPASSVLAARTEAPEAPPTGELAELLTQLRSIRREIAAVKSTLGGAAEHSPN